MLVAWAKEEPGSRRAGLGFSPVYELDALLEHGCGGERRTGQSTATIRVGAGGRLRVRGKDSVHLWEADRVLASSLA
jgi:hypothetical protein